MQHPDEGTIHAWLDGALSTDEAAEIDAHVKDCPECAAAVAEARGFIAASSRILTALDNAPRGVIPAAAPVKRRFDPMAWRIAASVLVIAGGTFLVVQNQGTRERPTAASTSTMDSSGSAATFKAVGESAPTAALTEAPIATTAASAPSASTGSRGDLATRRAVTQKTAPMAQKSVAPSASAGADRVVAAPAPAAISGFLPRAGALASEGAVAGGTAGPAQRLKVIGSPQRIGANVTVYEIGGDTVTLTESRPLALSNIVATGAAAARAQPQLRGRAAATRNGVSEQAAPASAPPVPPPPSVAAAPAPSVAAAPVQDAARPEDPNVVHTITWIDPVTRNTLSLSGRMPEAQLQLVRLRIEKERAAAKKTP